MVISYKLGTGRNPTTYVLAEQLAHTVTERHIADYIWTHTTVSREDIESDWDINKAIATEISRCQRFNKPATSVIDASHRLRMRYERMGRAKIEQLRMSLRKKVVGTSYIEVDTMKQKLADHFAQGGEKRGRGDYNTLYEEELESLRHKPDRQIICIYFTYYKRDGTKVQKQENNNLVTTQPSLPYFK